MPSQALLWQKLAFSSPFSYFNYLSSILLFRRHCHVALFNPSSRFVKDHVLFMPIHLTGVLCPFAQVPFALSSLAYLLNQSAARSCSPLFLFSNGVFSTSFISVVFFSRNGLTFARFFGFTHWSKKQLSFYLFSFLFHCPSGAILDLGTRSSRSGGVL